MDDGGRDAVREFSRRLRRLERGAGRSPRGGARFLSWFLAVNLAMVAMPPFIRPVDGRVTSGWSPRFKPDARLPAIEFHDGWDLAATVGTLVRAAATGLVEAVGEDLVLGRWVRVRHLFGFSSFYAHLSSVHVREGTIIPIPALWSLGRSGSTGRSTGPHLHFELRLGRWALPPGPFLAYHTLRRSVLGF